MKDIVKKYGKTLENEDGQGMAEYSLILAQVSIIAVSAILLYNQQLSSIFQNVLNALKGTLGK